jgi:hypothetical protein
MFLFLFLFGVLMVVLVDWRFGFFSSFDSNCFLSLSHCQEIGSRIEICGVFALGICTWCFSLSLFVSRNFLCLFECEFNFVPS